MKLKSVLIISEHGTLEFEDLEIPTLAMLDPWLNGGISGKVKATGLALSAPPVAKAAPVVEDDLPTPNPLPTRSGRGQREVGMLLHMLQFLARSGDTARNISDIKADLSRHGFLHTDSAWTGMQQGEKMEYVTKTSNGNWKLTKKGRDRAADPRLVVRGKIQPVKVTHVHAGEGVIK